MFNSSSSAFTYCIHIPPPPLSLQQARAARPALLRPQDHSTSPRSIAMQMVGEFSGRRAIEHSTAERRGRRALEQPPTADAQDHTAPFHLWRRRCASHSRVRSGRRATRGGRGFWCAECWREGEGSTVASPREWSATRCLTSTDRRAREPEPSAASDGSVAAPPCRRRSPERARRALDGGAVSGPPRAALPLLPAALLVDAASDSLRPSRRRRRRAARRAPRRARRARSRRRSPRS